MRSVRGVTGDRLPWGVQHWHVLRSTAPSRVAASADGNAMAYLNTIITAWGRACISCCCEECLRHFWMLGVFVDYSGNCENACEGVCVCVCCICDHSVNCSHYCALSLPHGYKISKMHELDKM